MYFLKRIAVLLFGIFVVACAAPVTFTPASTGTVATSTIVPSALTPTPTAPPSTAPSVSTTVPPSSETPSVEETSVPEGKSAISIENAKQVREVAIFGKGTLETFALSPDDKYVAVASTFGLALYDASTLKEIWNQSVDVEVASLVFSPDGKVLAWGSRDGYIRLWETVTGNEIGKISGLDGFIWKIEFSPDGKLVAASGGTLPAVGVWNVSGGPMIARLFNRRPSISDIAFSSDGRLFATADSSGVEIYDVSEWKRSGNKPLYSFPFKDAGYGLVFSSDVKFLAAGGARTYRTDNSSIKMWDTTNGREVATYKFDSDLRDVAISSDGKTLFGASAGIKVWNVANGQEEKTIGDKPLSRIQLTSDGKTVIAQSARELGFFDVASTEQLRALAGFTVNVFDFVLTSDGSTIITSPFGQFLDLNSGKLMQQLGERSIGFALALSPDGKVLASGSASSKGTITLWDIQNGKSIRTWNAHKKKITGLTFSPDGTLLASASDDESVKLWDAKDGSEIRTFINKAGLDVAFSPDGRLLASGTQDEKTRVWDVATGIQKYSLSEDGDFRQKYTFAVAFSPNGEYLASGVAENTGTSFAGKVQLWDVKSGRLVRAMGRRSEGVASLAFTADSKMLAAGGGDGAIELLDVATGQKLVTLKGHASSVNMLVFSEGDQVLISSSSDGTIRIWRILP